MLAPANLIRPQSFPAQEMATPLFQLCRPQTVRVIFDTFLPYPIEYLIFFKLEFWVSCEIP